MRCLNLLTNFLNRGKIVLLIGLLLLVFNSLAFAQSGDSYELSQWTIAGGGGSSAGGDYELTGTIGQSDTSPAMSGGDYTVVGGFLPGPISGGSGGIDTTIYLPVILKNK